MCGKGVSTSGWLEELAKSLPEMELSTEPFRMEKFLAELMSAGRDHVEIKLLKDQDTELYLKGYTFRMIRFNPKYVKHLYFILDSMGYKVIPH